MLPYKRTLLLSLTLLLALVLGACNVGNQDPVVVGETTPVAEATIADDQSAAAPSDPQVTTPTTDTTGTAGTTDTTGTTSSSFGLAGAEQGYMMLASNLLGREVVSTANDNLGSVEDFLVDLTDGNIPFALISHGGFLGIAQDQAPIPLSAMSVNPEQTALVLNVTQDQLQNFPDVDVSNDWPAGLDAGWDVELRDFWTTAGYNVDTIDMAQTGSVVRASQLVNAGFFGLGNGAEVDTSVVTDTTGTDAVVDANALTDYIVDLSQGRIMYAVFNSVDAGITTAGDAGVDQEWVVVPFQAISTDMQTGDAGEMTFGQNMSQEMLANAPRIQGANLEDADFFAPGWDEQIRTYWSEQGIQLQ